MQKLNLSDESDVRGRVLSGARKMNDLVSKTLGPAGQSVLIDRGGPEPLLVDDGRRVAENVKLDDPVEQMAARVLYAVTRKTDEKVGDGTTTSMVLATAILEEVAKNHIVSGGMVGTHRSVADVDRELHASKTLVVEKLRKMAKSIKTREQLVDVASVVAGSEQLGEVIGGMYSELGPDGHITMEFNLLSQEIETEVVPGYRFSGGYAAPWMISDQVRKTASMHEAPVLVCNRKDLDREKIQPLLQQLVAQGKNKLLIVAPKFEQTFLRDVFTTVVKGNFPILCVRAPSRGEEAYKDMAVFVGAKYFSDADQLGTGIQVSDLGQVDKVDVTDDTTILVGGKGSPEALAARKKQVEGEEKLQKLPQFKKDRQERISALTGAVGLIRIGAPTDEERNWLKHKIEDAVQATKHAYREGVVPAGGQAYAKAAEELAPDSIMFNVLQAPFLTLSRNAGGIFKPTKGEVDPVAVEIAALENAVSAAGKLIRIGGAIAYAPKPNLEQALKSVLKTNAEGDLIEDDNDE